MLPFLKMEFTILPTKQIWTCVHFLRIRSNALTQIFMAIFICIICSQLKEVFKSNKLFQNVNIWWISMASLAKRVFLEYCFLIVKMQVKFAKSEVFFKNLNSLCDVEFILGLLCILPLLECVHTLIKFEQHRDVFIYNFMDIFKPTQQDLFKFYYDPFTKYEDPTFDYFNYLIFLSNDTLN
jgi:hypothetical protein